MDLSFYISDAREEELENQGKSRENFDSNLFTINDFGNPIEKEDTDNEPKRNEVTNAPDSNPPRAGNNAGAGATEDINVIFEREQMKERMQQKRINEVYTKRIPLVEQIEQEEAREAQARQRRIARKKNKAAQKRQENYNSQQQRVQQMEQARIVNHHGHVANDSFINKLFGKYTIECMFFLGLLFGIILMLIFDKRVTDGTNPIDNFYHGDYEYRPFSPFVMPSSFQPAPERVTGGNFAIVP